MGRLVLLGRLAARDLRRRRLETALLLLAILAATTTLTLGLVLREAAEDPYERTRAATSGPDVVASVAPHADVLPQELTELVLDEPADLSRLTALASLPGVVDHSGPYPVAAAELLASGRTSDVQAVGRDTAPASVDQPELVQGGWVTEGGVVVEAAFAQALGLRVGDPVTLDGRSFDVVGIAVTAAMPPFPAASCIVAHGCMSRATTQDVVDAEVPEGVLLNPGLVWLTEADVRRIAPDPNVLSYVTNLQLADPASARSFVEANLQEGMAAPRLESWEDIRGEATELARDAQILLGIGAWLLALLAVASLSVLVGGRMADQTRRVGLLKAVGGTPGLVVAVLLTEHAVVAAVAAAGGLVIGSLSAPLLTAPGAGLIGSAGTPPFSLPTVAMVTALALVVATAATFAPALRAARTSTVDALADAARPPRRSTRLISASARLPAPLLLAVRVAARRPRRVALGAVSIAVTVSGIFVAQVIGAHLTSLQRAGAMDETSAELLGQLLGVVIVMVLVLAAINAAVITWATVLDNRHASALTRALGATPRAVSAALAGAQVLPALGGAVLGAFVGGPVLFTAIMAITGGDGDRATPPSLWQLLGVVLATGLLVAALTVVPVLLGSRRPVAETLRAELA